MYGLLAQVLVFRGLLEDLRRGLGGRFDVFVADLDRGDAEFAGLAGVGVADRAFAGGDRFDHAGGALRGLAALDRPVAADFVLPDAGDDLGEVFGEVLRRARLVRAVDRGDPGVGQFDAGVVLGDRRVVPGGDFLVEDLRQRFRVELQPFDAFEVVDDRDRRDVGRNLDQFARVAALRRLVQFAFFFVESAASLPAKATPPAMNCSRPPPEPTAS